jgi:hypothetical protein
MSTRRRGTAAISALLVVLGLAVIVRTVQAGALRLYLATRT